MRALSLRSVLPLFPAAVFGLAVLPACSGGSDDSAPTTDSDADADTDTDADVDDTAPPSESVISGTVVAYDGPVGAGVEVQVCITSCYAGETDASGAFRFEGLDAGEYKLDVVGEGVEGKDYGRIRVQAMPEQSAEWAAPSPLFLPKMVGPTPITAQGTYTFGAVRWTVDPSILTIPIGYDADQYSVGVVDGANVGAFWPVTPTFAVAFGPLATEVSGSFDIAVDMPTAPAGAYDVYSVGFHGDLEGPVGTATADGTTVQGTVTPAYLTWLLFVPHA